MFPVPARRRWRAVRAEQWVDGVVGWLFRARRPGSSRELPGWEFAVLPSDGDGGRCQQPGTRMGLGDLAKADFRSADAGRAGVRIVVPLLFTYRNGARLGGIFERFFLATASPRSPARPAPKHGKAWKNRAWRGARSDREPGQSIRILPEIFSPVTKRVTRRSSNGYRRALLAANSMPDSRMSEGPEPWAVGSPLIPHPPGGGRCSAGSSARPAVDRSLLLEDRTHVAWP